jgi:hypothetical protein
MAKTNRRKAKKDLTKIGVDVPGNLKFAIIVTVGIFWSQFLRDVLTDVLGPLLENNSNSFADLILALAATGLGFLILSSYKKIRSVLDKIKV